MLTFMLHIQVREDCVGEALETLSAIERSAQADPGMLTFTWLRHQDDPTCFTLVEQWDNQVHLEAHLRRDPTRWERFTPCLATEPRSVSYDAVTELVPSEVSG